MTSSSSVKVGSPVESYKYKNKIYKWLEEIQITAFTLGSSL